MIPQLKNIVGGERSRAAERIMAEPPNLLDALREDLLLVGPMPDASTAFCGACTILLDGEPCAPV